MRPRILLSLYCICFSIAVVAQVAKKANRYYNAALQLRSTRHTDKACKKMELAIKSDPSYADAYVQLGQWYFELHNFGKATEVFKKASLHCKDGARRFAKPLAKSYIYAGQADNALGIIGSYATIKDSAEWRKMKEQALFVRQAIIRRGGEDPTNLGIRINSKDPELFPSITADTSAIYFTRRVNNMDEDLYSAAADSCGGWFTAQNMGTPPNTSDQESSQFISADGHYLFFTRCDNRTYDGWAEGGCDLFMAYRIANDSPWTTAQPFGATINTLSYEGMPSLSADNRELYFVSDREGGYGGYDIWISRFENGLWQMPFNAGPNINTPGNETAPYINIDNKTLYFTSDGWPGMGGNDLFISRKINDSTWERCENLGYPINTANDEKSAFVTADGKTLYFGSDRNGPAGNYDLYTVPLSLSLQPVHVSYLQGYVYDSLTQQRLNSAAMYICNATYGDTLYQFQSNRGDASFLITLPVDKSYAIHTGHMGYTQVDDTLFFGKKYMDTPMQKNIAMLPVGYTAIKPINDSLIATIHFDVNKVELTDSDKTMLRDAIAPWVEEKGIVIYVNAYTDNTGTPMINEELSAKRANFVAKEVINLGIDEINVQAKGWGEAKMIAPNDTEEGQRKNRRVEIIINR